MSSDILIQRRDQEQVLLRTDLDDRKARVALKTLAMKMPERRQKLGNAHWFSPDELLLFVDDAKKSVGLLKAKLPENHLVHDVSGARVVFKLEGPYLRDLLAKGAPRDMQKVKIGEVVRTRLGQVAVAFWFLDETTAELVCFRSVSDYVEKWLQIAAKADGLPVL